MYMYADFQQVFDGLWASIKGQVAALLADNREQTDYICERLLGLSQRIDAKWAHPAISLIKHMKKFGVIDSFESRMLSGTGLFGI
jgi:hypothetical protein